MKNFAFIFARGGSKGVPGKNILPLAGKPLLAYSIEIAQQIQRISRIFVSTDDECIANLAAKLGIEVIPRPIELAQDDSPEWLAWRHAVNWLKEQGEIFDRFISLPTTSPLRNSDDINACLDALDDKADVVVTMTETSRSPWFNMVREMDGYVHLLAEGGGYYIRRQDVPKIFNMTTVAYVTRPDFILHAKGVFEGRVKGVIIPNERAIDIDTKLDFRIAEVLLKNLSVENMGF